MTSTARRRPNSKLLIGISAAVLGLCCCGGITAVVNRDGGSGTAGSGPTTATEVGRLIAETPTAEVTPTAEATPTAEQSAAEPSRSAASPRPTGKSTPKQVYYANCSAVRSAGKAPLRRGAPGYRAGLDADGDGVACESSERSGSSGGSTGGGSTSTGGGSTGGGSGSSSVYYANCSAVRAAGKAPLHRGDPGYSRKLDRDGDGVACE